MQTLDITIYYALSVVFFSLGFLGRKGLSVFLILISILPLSNSFAFLFYKYGFYVFEYYFLSSLFVKFVKSKLKIDTVFISIGVLIFVLTLYFFISTIDAASLNKYILRDFRILIYFLEIYIVYLLLMDSRGYPSRRFLLLIVAISGLSNILWLVAISGEYIAFPDLYYQQNTYRYYDLSTYISAVFIIFYWRTGNYEDKVLTNFAMLVSVASVLASNFRALIALVLVALLVNSVKRVKGVFMAILLGVMVVSVLVVMSQRLDAKRLSDLSVEGFAGQLQVRFSPYFNETEKFEVSDYLVGRGHGAVFYIPWFEYRENLDVFNNSVDNTYLTLFYKYGLFSIYLVAMLIFLFYKIAPSSDLFGKSSGFIFLFGLMFFYSLPFQVSSIGIYVGLLVVRLLVEGKGPRQSLHASLSFGFKPLGE